MNVHGLMSQCGIIGKAMLYDKIYEKRIKALRNVIKLRTEGSNQN